jgi:hypothetical protein
MDLILPGGASLFSGSRNYMESGNVTVPNPTEDDLITALAAMERGDIEFVILQDDENKIFMQAAGTPHEGYVLEYNDNADNSMYRATNPGLTGSHITDALSSFLNRDTAWASKFHWERFTF